jgi:hypothetical protein
MLRAGAKCSERMELTDAAGDAFSDSFSVIAFFLTSLPAEVENHAHSLPLDFPCSVVPPSKMLQTQLF